MIRPLLALAALVLSTLSAFAADDYACDFTITREGRPVGTIELAQAYGTTTGHLYTVPVSAKKDVFGKTVKKVEISLDGTIDNQGGSGNDSSIKAELILVTTQDRGGVIAHRHSVVKTRLGKIEGKGTLTVNLNSTEGYVTQGYCETRDGE